MTREEVRELHYITHVENLASILQHGILSHNEVKRRGLPRVSVAMEEIQQRRRKQVPGGRALHDYANLYLNARNPMMFRLVKDSRLGHARIVVVRVSAAVLDRPGVVVADRNASKDYVLFRGGAEGLNALDSLLVFAKWWTDEDPFLEWRKKGAICAEVLVPRMVPPGMLTGVHVSCPENVAVVDACGAPVSGLDIAVNPRMFFL